MTTQNPFLWENYQQFPPDVQEQMLLEFAALLPELPWRQAADAFSGAPAEVILKHLKGLPTEAQVRIYRNYLPMKAYEEAKKLLTEEAKIALKLRSRVQCL